MIHLGDRKIVQTLDTSDLSISIVSFTFLASLIPTNYQTLNQ